MRRVHMSVVTASRGEMMQVTPDAARARPKRTFYLSAADHLHKVVIYWKKTIGTYKRIGWGLHYLCRELGSNRKAKIW